MANDIFKIRKRPKKDPLTWIKQGEYGEGDPVGESNIRGVTNRPLKELLQNDLDLLRYMEKALIQVSEIESSKLNEDQHFDKMGLGLEHLDMATSPNRRFFSVAEITHHDHHDYNEMRHLDHSDHSDIDEVDEIAHIDQEHQDEIANVPHLDHRDHADTHGDHSDNLSRPHSDVPHLDHGDHLDYVSTEDHGDHSDHANIHGDECYPLGSLGCHSDHNDHLDISIHNDCSTEVLPQMLGVSCESDGKHYDYHLHSDYPDSYTSHHDGHSILIQCLGYCHDDHGDGFAHLDGHREWFYSDVYNHGDYPSKHTDHSDSLIPNHTDHGDNSSGSHIDHYDHLDFHSDHSDIVIVNAQEDLYVNYTDHLDHPHLDKAHSDHNDHSDYHTDQDGVHLDKPEHTDHLDIREIKHSDHRDVSHEDKGYPHLDLYPPNTTYHLDYTPTYPAYHSDSGEEHYDLNLAPEAHLDRGFSSPRDLLEGIYEEIYKGVVHGDRSIHHDFEGHGDVDPGDEEHDDHSDIRYHADHPHGDTPYQDYYGPRHSDKPPEQEVVHYDHIDGIPPKQLHQDSIRIQTTSPYQDHMDLIHNDYHLDNPHLDETEHLDKTKPAAIHTDLFHGDHSEHLGWVHEDHLDADLVFGKWKYIASYSDHGDYVFYQDFPHLDGTTHLDYIPNHEDHGDHIDLKHGDIEEEIIHANVTIPESHQDFSVPHVDRIIPHADFYVGGYIAFYADHTDHGDMTIQESHGDETYTRPYVDSPHDDHTDIRFHSDGPRGPQHEDLYYHSDIPHTDKLEHKDRTTTG
jgi:hypothetical protein